MATDETGEHQPRATTASIDRRVERLEASQAALDTKVAALDVKVDFIREFMALKFSSLETSISSQSARLDVFITRIEGLITEGLKQQSDLDASPLGRTINKRISRLETRADEEEKFRTQFTGIGAFLRFYVLPIIAIIVSFVAASGTIVPK